MRQVVLFLILVFSAINLKGQDSLYPYNSPADRDPMSALVDEKGRILIEEKKDIEDFVLQGIMYSPQGSVVIINGEMFKEGDKSQDYIIKGIKKDGVVVEKDGKDYFLKWEG
ncbi:MAG: hypothetical protein ABH858_01045 [Candidatus Omnitrophota bacterium]